MPWEEVELVYPFPIPQSRKCPDCQVSPGSPHIEGCDVERCSSCGGQRLSCCCSGEHDKLFSRWTGFWPGDLECLALGLICKWTPYPGNKVPLDDRSDGQPGCNLNKFYILGLHKQFFIKPGA